MSEYQIQIGQCSRGWGWSVLREDATGALKVIADSFNDAHKTAAEAAAEAEAEIIEPGRALRLYRAAA